MGRKRPIAYTADSSLAQILKDTSERLDLAEKQLYEFQQLSIPRSFSSMPLFVIFLLFAAGIGVIFWQMGQTQISTIAAGSLGGLFVVIWLVHLAGYVKGRPTGEGHRAVAGAGATDHPGRHRGGPGHGDQTGACAAGDRGEIQGRPRANRRAVGEGGQHRAELRAIAAAENRGADAAAQPKNRCGPAAQKLQHIEAQHLGWREKLQGDAAALEHQITEQQSAGLAGLTSHEQSSWDEIVADWQREITPIYQEIEAIQTATAARFPAWDAALVEAWKPPTEFIPATKFGTLSLDLAKPPAALPRDPRLALPGPKQVSLPLALTFPGEGSLLFETKDSGGASVIGTMNNVILRLIANTPPGKFSFTFIDPVGLGQNFAGLMHLADYEESLVNRRIWTQRDQIEERLAEMSEHIEKVIQMYLRNDYATITEYNEKPPAAWRRNIISSSWPTSR